MSATHPAPKGPWTHRFLVHLFTVVLTVLIYWLLGFIVDDIGTWPGPEYSAVEQRMLDQQREPVQRDYETLMQRHNLKMAALKLATLAPLLVVAVVLFIRRRGTLYAPLIYAFGIALLVKVALVMHEYFPSRYFKYVL